jgi:hypothetical protein
MQIVSLQSRQNKDENDATFQTKYRTPFVTENNLDTVIAKVNSETHSTV